MVKVQVSLNDFEDQVTSIHKIQKRLKTKAEAIKDIIRQFQQSKNKGITIIENDNVNSDQPVANQLTNNEHAHY